MRFGEDRVALDLISDEVEELLEAPQAQRQRGLLDLLIELLLQLTWQVRTQRLREPWQLHTRDSH